MVVCIFVCSCFFFAVHIFSKNICVFSFGVRFLGKRKTYTHTTNAHRVDKHASLEFTHTNSVCSSEAQGRDISTQLISYPQLIPAIATVCAQQPALVDRIIIGARDSLFVFPFFVSIIDNRHSFRSISNERDRDLLSNHSFRVRSEWIGADRCTWLAILDLASPRLCL